MRTFVMTMAFVLWAGVALAQHSHGSMTGLNGGPMQDVNVFAESKKPTSVKGLSSSLLIAAGNRETVRCRRQLAEGRGEGRRAGRRRGHARLEEHRRQVGTGEVLTRLGKVESPALKHYFSATP